MARVFVFFRSVDERDAPAPGAQQRLGGAARGGDIVDAHIRQRAVLVVFGTLYQRGEQVKLVEHGALRHGGEQDEATGVGHAQQRGQLRGMALDIALRIKQHIEAVGFGRGLQAENDLGIEGVGEIGQHGND